MVIFSLYLLHAYVLLDKPATKKQCFLITVSENFSNKILHFFFSFILGFIEDGEKLDPYKLSIIVMFTLFQFFYMIVCLIGTRLLFNYEFINSIALILVCFITSAVD